MPEKEPSSPVRQTVPVFVAPNPPTPQCPKSAAPHIHPSAYLGPFACVIGDVTLCEHVFLAPHVSVRADEGTPFYIGAYTNLQDGVIIHGLEHGRVRHDGRNYSVYVGEHVSCGHGCILHGPCELGAHVFVGFQAVVMSAAVGAGSYISPHAVVMGGVHVPAGRIVPAGMVVDTQKKADALPPVPQSGTDFAAGVQRVNNAFPNAYTLLFGATRCSCGLACDEPPEIL